MNTTQSASVTALLAHFDGVESTDALLERAVETKTSTYGAVHMQLWTAFTNFESAEGDYVKALGGLQDNTEMQIKYITKGNTADPMWIMQYAQRASDAAAEMTAAVKVIMTLKALFRTL